MKMATAIKRGAKLVKSQVKGRYVSYEKRKGGVCGCAIGVAYLYLYPEELELVEKRKHARGVNDRAGVWADLNGQGEVAAPVAYANDTVGLGFDDIASALIRGRFDVPDTNAGLLVNWTVFNPEIEKPPVEELEERARIMRRQGVL